MLKLMGKKIFTIYAGNLCSYHVCLIMLHCHIFSDNFSVKCHIFRNEQSVFIADQIQSKITEKKIRHLINSNPKQPTYPSYINEP